MLDLIAENEERLAPGRTCDSSGEYPLTFTNTRMYMYKYASGKKKQDGLRHHYQQRQHSTPKTVPTKPSAKIHSRTPSKHSTTSTPHHHQRSSTTGGTVRTPTTHSTPTTDHVTPHSLTRHVGGDTSPTGVTINDEIRLRELFSLLKGYELLHSFPVLKTITANCSPSCAF